MTNILHIDSSINGDLSISKKYSKKIVERLLAKYPDAHVEHLDLGNNPLGQITENWVRAMYTEPEKRTEEQKNVLLDSDVLVEQLKKADIIVIGCPMYNFSIPSNLKVWIDKTARKWSTFDANNNGMVLGKKCYIVFTRGGSNYEEGEKLHFLNGQVKSLIAPLSFIGIRDVEDIKINGSMNNPSSPKYQQLIENADKLVNDLKI